MVQADVDGVKVLLELLELQLTFSQLVKGDPQEAVLVKLPDVVKACRRTKGHQMILVEEEVGEDSSRDQQEPTGTGRN